MPPTGDPIDAVAHVAGHFLHRCRDAELLQRALTHASHIGANATAQQRRDEANERLEFLGDALLGAALAEWLCERQPEADEGELSRLRARLASRETLARVFDRVELRAWCRIGPTVLMPGEEALPVSVRANLVEAVLAAIHHDGGWLALVAAVRRIMADEIGAADAAPLDPRTALQHWCLGRHQRLPEYTWARAGGSDHEPRFTARAAIDGHEATGEGTSRRRAEAAAAAALLQRLQAG